jgi:hypothetical protein
MMIDSSAAPAWAEEDPSSPEDWGRLLRKACKSKFFKQVTEESISDVLDKASAQGLAPQEFINLVCAIGLHSCKRARIAYKLAVVMCRATRTPRLRSCLRRS